MAGPEDDIHLKNTLWNGFAKQFNHERRLVSLFQFSAVSFTKIADFAVNIERDWKNSIKCKNRRNFFKPRRDGGQSQRNARDDEQLHGPVEDDEGGGQTSPIDVAFLEILECEIDISANVNDVGSGEQN